MEIIDLFPARTDEERAMVIEALEDIMMRVDLLEDFYYRNMELPDDHPEKQHRLTILRRLLERAGWKEP